MLCLNMIEQTLAKNWPMPSRDLMGELDHKTPSSGKALRWAVWGCFLLAWTVVLLTSRPIQIRDALFGEKMGFVLAKGLHVTAYAALTVFTGWLRLRSPYRWLLLGLIALHGVGTEMGQVFVPLRTGSWHDVALDVVGIAVGFVLTWKWWIPNNSSATLTPNASEFPSPTP